MAVFLSRLESGDLVALVGIFVVFGIGGIISAVTVWGQVRKAQIAADLKQDLLDRGMSPEDIKTVLDAGPHP